MTSILTLLLEVILTGQEHQKMKLFNQPIFNLGYSHIAIKLKNKKYLKMKKAMLIVRSLRERMVFLVLVQKLQHNCNYESLKLTKQIVLL
jgi:hypothetical protein